MITKTKQIWQPGQIVKVGFLTLQVIEYVEERTENYYRLGKPGAYDSPNAYRGPRYDFVPHRGLFRQD